MNNNCNHCTFLNESNVKICAMCAKSLKITAASTIDEDSDGIQCNNCTFLNASGNLICEICRFVLWFHVVSDDELSDDELSDDELSDEGDKLATQDGAKVSAKMEQNIDKTDEIAIDEYPQQECKLCYEAIGTDYFAMFDCVHIFCKACAVGYFTNQITQRPILDCICPMCDLPDLHLNADNHEQYFSLLLASLKPMLDKNIVNVLEKKLTEVALVKDPNFVWCIQCTSGFLKNSRINMVCCPDCRVRFCCECKKVWEPQHMNLTCERFAQWQRDNNFQVSQDAIGNYLRKNGIDCPKCKFKYDLSRGGCIHFTCTQCKHEFCFGCSKLFLRQCTIAPYCKNVGLHAHHKRNCFYYLRDKTVADLQNLLKLVKNNIPLQ